MVIAVNPAMLTGEYRTEFSITGLEQPDNALFWQVFQQVQDWFERMPGDSEPMMESGEIEALAYRRFQIELPHGQNPIFQLRLDVKLSARGGPVSVSVQSSFLETDGATPPPELLAGPPSLIRELLEAFTCYRGSDLLSATPTLITLETARDFADDRILNPDRQLPIIAVSQDWRGRTPVNPARLQALLSGMAEVATYDSYVAEQLRQHLGFQLACFNGAIRIYQPGCSREDQRGQHNFWMPGQSRDIGRQSAGRLVQEFARYLPEVTDTHEFETVRRQVQQKRMAEQAAELLALPLRQQIVQLEAEIASLNVQLQERERDNTTEETKINKLHQQLVDRDTELESLRSQLEQVIHREAEREPEIAHLHQQQVERDERIELLRQQLESALSQAGTDESEIAQLHTLLLERDSNVESLRQELDKAVHREAEIEQEITLLHVQIQESDTQAELLRQQLENVMGEAGASRLAIEQLEANIQERDRELGVLRSQLEDALNWSQGSKDLINELSEEVKIRDADIAKLRLLLEGVENGSVESEQIIAELNRELQERTEEAEGISILLDKVRERADAAENAAAELRRELSERPSELAEFNSLISQSQENIAYDQPHVAETNGIVAGLRQEIERLRGEIASMEQLLEEAQQREQAVAELISDLDRRDSEIAQRDTKIRWLEYELDRVRGNDPVLEFEHHYEEPDTIKDAVECASQRFGKLRFLDSAFESADGHPYQDPGKVYKNFELLQELAVARTQGPLHKTPEGWMRERGFNYASNESKATRNEFGQFRQIEGYLMEGHMKIGGGTHDGQHLIRIHFCWEKESQQYIIGHVGEHLPTVSG